MLRVRILNVFVHLFSIIMLPPNNSKRCVTLNLPYVCSTNIVVFMFGYTIKLLKVSSVLIADLVADISQTSVTAFPLFTEVWAEIFSP